MTMGSKSEKRQFISDARTFLTIFIGRDFLIFHSSIAYQVLPKKVPPKMASGTVFVQASNYRQIKWTKMTRKKMETGAKLENNTQKEFPLERVRI